MRTLLVSLISMLSMAPCISQKEANIWVVGDDYGIDFNHNRFTVFDRPSFNVDDNRGLFTNSASICDPQTGALLFYTEGQNVWNRDFHIMPNGRELNGGRDFGQTVLIVPYPDQEDLYYLFTTRLFEDSVERISPSGEILEKSETGLYYSIIDMQLDRGRGDLIPALKNQLLLKKSSETLTAVPHINGQDFWLLTHEWGTDRFVVYPVTSHGIGKALFFTSGQLYNTDGFDGYLQASPNGKMLVFLAGNSPGSTPVGVPDAKNPIEWYNFDAATGTIFNRRVLGFYPNPVSAAFSPDNTKLYFSYYKDDTALSVRP